MKELKRGQRVALSWRGTRGSRVEKRGVITGIYRDFITVRTGPTRSAFSCRNPRWPVGGNIPRPGSGLPARWEEVEESGAAYDAAGGAGNAP